MYAPLYAALTKPLHRRDCSEVHQRKNTPDTTAGVKCASKKNNSKVEFLAVPSASNSSFHHSTDVFLSSHESVKSTLAEGDSTDTTSQHFTIDSDAMDFVALDSHGMDVVALNVGQVGGAVDAAPEQVRKISREELMTQRSRNVHVYRRAQQRRLPNNTEMQGHARHTFWAAERRRARNHRICRSPPCIQVQVHGAAGISCDPVLPWNA